MSPSTTPAPRPLTERDYNALPGVRWSHLRGLRVSPAQCQYESTREWGAPGGYRAIGSAVHALVLTPQTADVAIFDGSVRRGKTWDAYEAEHAGETIVTAGEWQTAQLLATRLGEHPIAGPLLAAATYQEHAVEWTETTRHGPVHCKARIDCLSGGYLCDLKTTRREEPRSFARDCVDYGYAEQLAYYARGLAHEGHALTGARLVVVSTEAPYSIGVLDVDGRLLASADTEVLRLLELYAECQATGRWPGWGDDGVLALGDYWPRWAELGNDDSVTLGGEVVST
jgi:hypothetical protein